MSDPHPRQGDVHPPREPRRRGGPLGALRASFLTGLVVVLPISVTIWVIWTVVGWIDDWVLPLVPHRFRPENYIGINLRGVGVIIFLVFTVVVGWLAKGLIGRSLIRWAERLVDRMPVVRSIYNGLKQIAETVFAQTETTFDRAVMVEYPRRGSWMIGFVSTAARGEIAEKLPISGTILTVFVPTTPNPTSGFLLFLPESEVMPLDMGVEDAAKLVISAGLVYPGPKEAAAAAEAAVARARRRA